MSAPIGTRWRILAHEFFGRGKMNGRRLDIHSSDMGVAYQRMLKKAGIGKAAKKLQDDHKGEVGFEPTKVVPYRTVFDELVLDNWFHLEQMDDSLWWMRVGDFDINVHVQRGGKAKSVRIEWGHAPNSNPPTGSATALFWEAK